MTFKEFRLSQGLSQPKIAKALGIGVSTVGAYDLGRIHPSAKVLAKIKEVFGVDLNGDAPAAPAPAEPDPVVEEKAVKPKHSRKKKEATAEAAPAEPVPAVEEAPAKPAKRTRKKKEAEPAPAPVIEEKAEKAPAKKPRARKKIIEKDPLLEQNEHSKKRTNEAVDVILGEKKGTVIIQSPMGGEITPEDVLAKVGPVDKVYVRVDLNTAFWVRGDESGAVNLW